MASAEALRTSGLPRSGGTVMNDEKKIAGGAFQTGGAKGPCQTPGVSASGRAGGKTVSPNIDLDDLFTLEEVAAKLKMKVRTLRAWMEKRWIPYTEGKRLKYILGEDLREIFRRNYKPALRRPPSIAPREQGGAEEEKEGGEL